MERPLLSDILPALPAGRAASLGSAIPAQEIRELVEATDKTNPVEAVAIQLSVAIDVFEAIRDGHPDWVGLAVAALIVLDVDCVESIRQVLARHSDGAQRLWDAIHEEGVTDE